ncbi:MAG: class III poly(R)-hydroxyalkanoic acid synthase subunit PhaC, partial [Nitrososphaerales archaeon]
VIAAKDAQSKTDLSLYVQRQMLDLYTGFVRALPMFSSLHEIVNKTTPHDVVYEEDNVKLLHYRAVTKRIHRTPLLIIYALVNRHYILDLENRSVIRNLLDQGFDIYMIDWGASSNKERKLTIDDYVNGYVDRCVDVVRKISNCRSVSLFGYCMGGTFATIYTALHKEKVKNLMTLAPPIDCSKDTTVFGSLARFLEIDNFVDRLGDIPPSFQYLFFFMLKPFKHYIGKYNEVAEKIDDKDFIDNFMQLERWLWDTPPIPGEVFRQWVKDIYQKNLLVQNSLQIGKEVVDISKIDVPLLNIVADSDHLVSPESSKALNYAVSSKDKTLMLFPTGHIGLCASSYSQKEVWPKVCQWLMERSD